MNITERLAIELQILMEHENGSMTGGFASLRPYKIVNSNPSAFMTNDDECQNGTGYCAYSVNSNCHNTSKAFCNMSSDSGTCTTAAHE